jgi:hypothetical protein
MEVPRPKMSERNTNSEPPAWHREYLADREKALASGEDVFITLEELESDLRGELGR